MTLGVGGSTPEQALARLQNMMDGAEPITEAEYQTRIARAQALMREQGIAATAVKKVLEGRPNIVDAMKNGDVQLVFNTTEGKQSIQDSFSIRRSALMMKIPYYTTTAGALAAAQAIALATPEGLEVRALQSY